ncbi:MAG: hypothetical protein IT244_04300, partial [Bacteroidia bacterium]|nr:hypothetical protein [Bacteroidia bacterium]
IVGPYTSVNAKLIHVESKYRKNNDPAPQYTEQPDDERFVKYLNSDVVAISHAQNDSGVFELNFRDEKYMPFEGMGAVSKWELELPTEVKQFDYNSISDILVHIKYTAREGGDDLKEAANDALKAQLDTIKLGLKQAGLFEGLHVAMNVKHDLPNEWHLMKKNGSVDMLFDKSRLPYMVQALDVSIVSVLFIAKIKENPAHFSVTTERLSTITENSLEKIDGMDLYYGIDTSIPLNSAFKLTVESIEDLEDLTFIVKYRF